MDAKRAKKIGSPPIRGNEEADRLAGEGATKPAPTTPQPLEFPEHPAMSGASIAKLEQRDFYKIIRDKRHIPVRTRTERNIGIIQACAKDTFDFAPTPEAVWKATKHKDLSRKTRDFIWKSTQNAYKIGEYWYPIEGFEERGTCPLCKEQEDMDHILTRCSAHARSTAWELAGNLWKNRSGDPLPSRLGDIVGCGLANFKKNGRPDKGKNRLYRILVSETAFLIWKMRNERRIRDGDDTTAGSEEETMKRWTHAINKRLTIDRALTDAKRFGKRSLDSKLVKATWRGCLENETDLPDDWYNLRGVLVGILQPRPPGRGR